MNPEQIAKSGTEHAEQTALFCWANMAQCYGFAAADNMANYKNPVTAYGFEPIKELRWMHAIPNAGARGNKVAAAQLVAEGVKSGVADIFLPVVQWTDSAGFREINYAGLYIELKRLNGKPSDVTKEQREFGEFVLQQGYEWKVCYGWKEAAQTIQSYLKHA